MVVAGAFVSVLCAPFIARAQSSLVPSTGWRLGPTVSAWHFDTPLPQPGGAVADVAEAAIPMRLSAARRGWTADLTGAVAYGAVHVQDGEDEGRLLSVAGPTDLRLRVTGPVIGDATMLTVGLNLPTGRTGLSSDETNALQVLAAPGLQMPVTAFGMGFGATLGLVRAFQGDGWAVAVGASGEKRTEYSPVTLALVSGTSETMLTPGMAAHLTVGYDRTVGQGRLGMLLVGDFYSKDELRFSGDSIGDTSSDYTLGPQVTATAQFDFGAAGWRESSAVVGARARAEYSDALGAKVAGSSGTYFEGALHAVRGGARGAGLVLGADARWHSGMPFTEALVGAAVSAAGLTIGYDHAGQSTSTRFVVHGTYGTFDTGTAKSTGMNLSLGLSIGARREAQ